MSGIQRHLDRHAGIPDIHHLEAAPGFLGKHDLLVDLVHIRLDITGLHLVRHQNPLRAGRHHQIFKAHAQYRHIQLVHHMHIFTLLIEHGLTDTAALHCLSERIPCAHVLPHARKPHNLDLPLMFHYRIVKADFGQRLILPEKILIIRKINQFMGPLQHVTQTKSKHAAVPERALLNILSGYLFGGLLLKYGNTADRILIFRNDIAVLGAWIGRLYTHKHQIRSAYGRTAAERLQCPEIIFFHIGIHRADHHCLFFLYPSHVMQVSRRQRNGRKRISAAWLHTDPHILSQLVMDGGNLRFGGGDRHLGLAVHGQNLTVHTLHHRLILPVRRLEDLNELFRSGIVGKRPQTLAGSSR